VPDRRLMGVDPEARACRRPPLLLKHAGRPPAAARHHWPRLPRARR
jgi:hypothetical protein